MMFFNNNKGHAPAENSVSISSDRRWAEYQEMLQRKALYEEELRQAEYARHVDKVNYEAAVKRIGYLVNRYLNLLLAVNEIESDIFRVWGNYDIRASLNFVDNCVNVVNAEMKFANLKNNTYLISLLEQGKAILYQISQIENANFEVSKNLGMDDKKKDRILEYNNSLINGHKFNFKILFTNYLISKEGIERIFFDPYFARLVNEHKKKYDVRWGRNGYSAAIYEYEQRKKMAAHDRFMKALPYVQMYNNYVARKEAAELMMKKRAEQKEKVDLSAAMSLASGL